MNDVDVYLESKITWLSLAVHLLDGYTKSEPRGWVEVFIEGRGKKPVRNPSFYYLLLDLPADNYSLRIESEYYFDEKKEVKDTNDPSMPLVITIRPMPHYPFPPGETLVRGILKDSNDKSVSEAGLSWKAGKGEGWTTRKGEYVMYFKGLTEEDIEKDESGRRFLIQGQQDRKLKIDVMHGDVTKTLSISDVELEKTNTINMVL